MSDTSTQPPPPPPPPPSPPPPPPPPPSQTPKIYTQQGTKESTEDSSAAISAETQELTAYVETALSSWVFTFRSMLKRIKRIFEIMTYFRLVIALALYALITVDLISIRRESEKRFWVEVITQVINAEFTLLTVLSHPKRIMNFPRAIKIYIASRNINYQQSELFTPGIKQLQMEVHKSYDWYLYEATRADLICSPRILLIVLFFWNIGSLAQYGISVILWFFTQRERPADIYTALNVVAIICEVLPISLVVWQNRKAKIAKKLSDQLVLDKITI